MDPRPLADRSALCARCLVRPAGPGLTVCPGCPALARPTAAPPGSEEKMALMRDRIAAGLPPCLPGDLTTAGLDRLDRPPPQVRPRWRGHGRKGPR